MALHWTDFELRLRDLVNEIVTGQISQATLARWANEAIKDLPRDLQLAKARIAIQFNNGVVTLLEEDWPGTEAVGVPTYAWGTEGAFYIQWGVDIDSIREIQERDSGDDDACGDPVYVYDWSYPQLYLKRQEHIQNYPSGDVNPTHYGCYRKWLYTARSPEDDPRPLTEPFEVLVVWFDPMFDYSDEDYYKYFEIQYRRIMPEIDLTHINDACGDFVEFTQPYFYIHEAYEDIIIKYVRMQALFALADKRYSVAVQEYNKARRLIRLNMTNRGSLDRQPRLEDPDAPLISRIRSDARDGGWESY